MNKPILATLFLTIGFLLGQYTFSKVFDPMEMLAQSNYLAASAYQMGCVEDRAHSLNGAHLSPEDSAWCKANAQALYEKFEALRKDPGHKVKVVNK